MFLDNAEFLPVVCQQINEGHSVTITARGNSMRPFIESDRDSVILSRCNPLQCRVGDVVLAEVAKGHFILHRIDAINGDDVTLRGDGNYPGTERCRRNDIRALMSAVIRRGHLHHTSGRLWRTYSRLWVTMLPLRRYLLALYRLLFLGQLPSHLKHPCSNH